MLNRVQSTRADDQRGLLCKEFLVLPEFLKRPDEICDDCQATCPYNDTELLQVDLHSEVATENCREQSCTTNDRSPSPETVCLSLLEETMNPLLQIRSNNDTMATETTPTVTISDLSMESTVINDKPHTEDNACAM